MDRDYRTHKFHPKASEVRSLRQRTGNGLLECKEALERTSGDESKAAEYLRTKGQAVLRKKIKIVGRTAQGRTSPLG